MRYIISLLALVCLATTASAQYEGGGPRRGSIYNADAAPVRPFSNKTASRVGDLVTVLIEETQDVKNEEKSDISKSSDLNYQLLDFDIDSGAFGSGSVLPSIQTTRDDGFSGNAKYEKKGAFTARLTAIVMDTLPNGNLVIQGRRELRIDKEIKVIEFSGIVRRYDITSGNTVQSELVADARISYSGTGPLTNATNRRGFSGWLYNALDWVWPF